MQPTATIDVLFGSMNRVTTRCNSRSLTSHVPDDPRILLQIQKALAAAAEQRKLTCQYQNNASGNNQQHNNNNSNAAAGGSSAVGHFFRYLFPSTSSSSNNNGNGHQGNGAPSSSPGSAQIVDQDGNVVNGAASGRCSSSSVAGGGAAAFSSSSLGGDDGAGAGAAASGSGELSHRMLLLDDTVDAWVPTRHEAILRAALHEETLASNKNAFTSDDSLLRRELWHGATEQPLLRAEAWRTALGVSSATLARRNRDAMRHLQEYRDYLELYYYDKNKHGGVVPTTRSSSSSSAAASSSSFSLSIFPDTANSIVPRVDSRTKTERDILRQLDIDLPRHQAALYRHADLCERLRRCLFVWSLRNPAVGYVQGMDDVVAIFFCAFLDEALAIVDKFASAQQQQRQQQAQQQEQGSAASSSTSSQRETLLRSWLEVRSQLKCAGSPNPRRARPWTADLDRLAAAMAALPACALDMAECDTYNCGGRFLSWGMDRYTFGQPGVFACVDAVAAGVRHFDPELYAHLREVCGLEFRTFAYKYCHLLLVRDLGAWRSMRLFDTLLSCGASTCWTFFAFFCVAWLTHERKKILCDIDPDEAMIILQEPSKLGMERDGSREAALWMDEMLSRAYLLIEQKKQQDATGANAAVVPRS